MIKSAWEIVGGVVAIIAAVLVYFSEDIAEKVEAFPTVNKWWCLAIVGVFAFHLWMRYMHSLFVAKEMEIIRLTHGKKGKK